jgi:hypothetical protein
MSPYPRFLSAFVLVLLFCPALPVSGESIRIIDNPVRREWGGFASSMTVVGDVDGDGVTDYMVGAYKSDILYPSPVKRSEQEDYSSPSASFESSFYPSPVNRSEQEGRAFVFSGKTGRLLFTLSTPTPMPYAAFGFAVSGAGDVNKDGTPDLFVGAFGYGSTGPLRRGATGRAFVFSGKDGQLLHTLQAPQPQNGAGFGWAVSSLGDANGDGVPELIVGAFAQDDAGKAFVFDGHTGRLLRALESPQPPGGSAFGWAVADAGDLNKDGIADILIGDPYSTVGAIPVQGRVYAFSGKDGTLLLTLDDPQPVAGEAFGWRVTSAGDLNKDGVPEILVGVPYKDVGANRAQGQAFVFNGADGKVLYTLDDPAPKPYAGFGHALAQGPDVDEDGAAEILVGAPFQSVDQFHVQGEVFVFNGWDGRHLITFDNPYPHPGALFGYSIASLGDVNGDKVPDFAVGASGQGIVEKVAVGRAFVFLSQ